MTQKNQIVNCPICEEGYLSSQHVIDGWTVIVECERCGRFKINPQFISDRNKPWYEVKHLVSAWIRRENKAGITPTIGDGVKDEDIYSSEWWSNQFTHMGFPETTNEKLNKLLITYADSIDGDYDGQFSLGQRYFIADVAAKNINEIDGLTRLLDELGYIDMQFPRILAKGWLHIDELRKTAITSESAFVAMWFDDSTKKYRDTVVATIEYCGYKAVVVDQQEYNDFIMNQVISLIRQSQLLIADFTSRPEIENDGRVKNGVRGGVYWEAGMAFGLGRPVIHTCEDSIESKKRIHFDVHQYNTIFWREDELGTEIRPLDQPRTNPNFAERLAARILATVGRGSYQTKNDA